MAFQEFTPEGIILKVMLYAMTDTLYYLHPFRYGNKLHTCVICSTEAYVKKHSMRSQITPYNINPYYTVSPSPAPLFYKYSVS